MRAGLIIPVSISKIIFTSRFYHKLAAILLILGCFAFAVGAGRHEDWTTGKTLFVGAAIAFFMIIVYGVFMEPKVARADRTDTHLTSGEVYYFYEDHIGRPIVMSSYNGLYGSYFKKYYGSELPYFVGMYLPFGQFDDFWMVNSGITIGDPDTTGIVWDVPFRFPGQYQDDVVGLHNHLYYNWNRWYMPGMGRYTQADPIGNVFLGEEADYEISNIYSYVDNKPILLTDSSGLYGLSVHFRKTNEWAKCNNFRLAFSNLFTDINPRTNAFPRSSGKDSSSARCYYHFTDTSEVLQRINSLLSSTGGCSPSKFGKELHALMDSFAHIRKGGACWPGQKSGADRFNPDPNGSQWQQIDWDMQESVQRVMQQYYSSCCCGK